MKKWIAGCAAVLMLAGGGAALAQDDDGGDGEQAERPAAQRMDLTGTLRRTESAAQNREGTTVQRVRFTLEVAGEERMQVIVPAARRARGGAGLAYDLDALAGKRVRVRGQALVRETANTRRVIFQREELSVSVLD